MSTLGETNISTDHTMLYIREINKAGLLLEEAFDKLTTSVERIEIAKIETIKMKGHWNRVGENENCAEIKEFHFNRLVRANDEFMAAEKENKMINSQIRFLINRIKGPYQ